MNPDSYRILIDSPAPHIPWGTAAIFGVFGFIVTVIGIAQTEHQRSRGIVTIGIGLIVAIIIGPILTWTAWQNDRERHEIVSTRTYRIASGRIERLTVDAHNVDRPVVFYLDGVQFKISESGTFRAYQNVGAAPFQDGDCARVHYNNDRSILEMGIAHEQASCDRQDGRGESRSTLTDQ
jgi:hypothetical protein